MTLDLSCPACGSNRIAFNHAVSDACDVTCEDCSAIVSSFGDLKLLVTEQLGQRD